MYYKMTREDNITLAKRNVIDSIWREANLEGINATFPDTQEIFYGRSVSTLKVDEVIAINNLKHAWEFILDTLDIPLDLSYIREVNKLVGEGIINCSGEIRTSPVRIGGTSYVPEIPSINTFEQIKEQINAINDKTISGVTAFLKLAKAQLFIDGNKRTAQLIANKILIQNGCGVFSIPVENISEFTKHLIEYYESKNEDNNIDYFISVGVSGFNSSN